MYVYRGSTFWANREIYSFREKIDGKDVEQEESIDKRPRRYLFESGKEREKSVTRER